MTYLIGKLGEFWCRVLVDNQCMRRNIIFHASLQAYKPVNCILSHQMDFVFGGTKNDYHHGLCNGCSCGLVCADVKWKFRVQRR